MVLLTQGKPGTLAQGHPLSCTKKHGECLEVMEAVMERAGAPPRQSAGRGPASCACQSVQALPPARQPQGGLCLVALIQAAAVVRLEAREAGPTWTVTLLPGTLRSYEAGCWALRASL